MSKVLVVGKIKVQEVESPVEFVVSPLIAMELGSLYNQMAPSFDKL